MSMRALYRSRRMRLACLILLVISIGLLVAATLIFQGHKQLQLAWQEHHTDAQTQAASLWLPDYRLVYEANIDLQRKDELSGLSWNAQSNTLFAVTGGTTQLLELSLKGEVLRRIALKGFSDLEAVENLGNGQIAVVDERRHQLSILPLKADTQQLELKEALSYDLGFAESANKGFEGLGWNPRTQRLLLAKERDPIGLFSLPLPITPAPIGGAPIKLHTEVAAESLIVRDLSSVTVDPRTGHLLLLSDESRVLLELDTEGKPRSFMWLIAGFNGLEHSIRQAEGVTMDADGRIYLVGEPNRLYVFEKTPRH